ncbi:hypothetical protein [Heyndrickxia coagulans]|uniref:Uncharacterized protein n=1 Tax=Heyndrickxia coagulans TaxID=1398 RepID=A0A150KHF0_HEYCO|nr:hypothetical protein [Heyndrickxia coagulans]KYC71902.1 hypothetical protein B4099_0603 [Heyndrickxia coagulans]MCR2847133.1 hypothetical protein [Heyndrickxia coagulans]
MPTGDPENLHGIRSGLIPLYNFVGTDGLHTCSGSGAYGCRLHRRPPGRLMF